MIDSIAAIKIGVTADTMKYLDPDVHYANYILTPGSYDTQDTRDEITEWTETAYEGNAEKWIYVGGNTHPHPSNNIESPLVAQRLIGWMMGEYDIEGYLYWATMKSKYMDGIAASTISSVIDKTVADGQIIELADFYNNAIHYGSTGGDGFLVYPGSYYNVFGPVGTVRVESLRDGIEDYSFINDLKQMYSDAGLEDSFYNAMARLSEMLYTGTRIKTQDGYVSEFQMARDSLANMLILARDSKVYVDDVYLESDTVYFTVVAPTTIAEAVKSAIDATFVSSASVTVNGVSGSKMTFEASSDMTDDGYITVSYDGKEINLSIKVLMETDEVEALEWNTVSNSAVYTTHRTGNSYSNADSASGATVSIVTLTNEDSIGGRTSGSYFYVEPLSTSDTSNLGFSVLPTQNKAYYQAYEGKAVLKFDVYMDCTYIADGSNREGFKVYYSLGKSVNSQTRAHEWFTVTVSFEQIIDNWDTLMANTTTTYDNWSTSWRALFAVNGASHDASGVHTTSYYIGNFRIEHI